jgi:hypothetical protein
MKWIQIGEIQDESFVICVFGDGSSTQWEASVGNKATCILQ